MLLVNGWIEYYKWTRKTRWAVQGPRSKSFKLGLFDHCAEYYSMDCVYFSLSRAPITPNETPYARGFQQSFRIKCHQLVAFHIRLENINSRNRREARQTRYV
jgi:hypothetical protein